MAVNIGYLGNPLLKGANHAIEWTPEMVEEYIKCKDSPEYFARTYIQIVHVDRGMINFVPYDYQEQIIKTVHENRFTILCCSRQSGKTTAISANILHYIIFNSEKTVALLANKGDTAREILSRIKLAYENLPNWLQQGVLKFNEGSIELENNSRVIATSTSSSAIRGYSCITDDSWVCIEENESIYYTQINKLITNMPTNEKKYTVYKTINKANNKIYIGFHSVPVEENVKTKSDFGSIFNDGYLGSGKLIKRAIEKYTPEGFYQELLGVFNSKKEAEGFEKSLVTHDFTLLDTTYNVTIGGNVCILHGENNGFYGKTHSDKLKQDVATRFTGNKSYSNKHNCKIKNNETGDLYLDFIEFKKSYPEYTKKTIIWEIGIGRFSYDDESRQKIAIDIYNEMMQNIEIQRKVCGDRFRGTERKEESKKLAGISIKSYIETHPEEHQEKMLKINKNPAKIAKTAEKHRGMKRSDKAKKNMSDAQLGKLRYKNKQTKEVIYLWDYEEIPDGFVLDKK